MNINEVIANKALELSGRRFGDYDFIHPLQDVNQHQSTNDTFPTALRVAVLRYLILLEESLAELQKTLQEKEKEFAGILKLGRTELQDALPMTFGMQFGAYAEALGRDRWRIFKSRERIKTVSLGGTAIGTGFGAPQAYIFKVSQKLRELTGLSICRAENLLEATQNLDPLCEVSGMLKALAVNLLKISGDLRWLSSGPVGGPCEILLPKRQEGSSIMPGKVNPVIPEFVSQISLLVMGNDSVLSHAAGLGNLELNQFYPLAAYVLLKNFRLLLLAVQKLEEKALRDLKVHEKNAAKHLDQSVAILTYLSETLGHEKTSEVYLSCLQTGKTIREMILEKQFLNPEEYDRLISPERIQRMGFKNT